VVSAMTSFIILLIALSNSGLMPFAFLLILFVLWLFE